MNKINDIIERINDLSRYCNILESPEEYFRHMQGHRTELSMVLSAFDIADNNETIIEALMKQTPKKVIHINEFQSHCPNCEDVRVNSSMPYCWKCGQKLEW